MWRYLLNRPLTLKELQRMSGEPVWVHVIDHTDFADPRDDFDGWGLCRTSWVRVWDESRADLVHIDYDFEDYGRTWVAYRKRPKRKENKIMCQEKIECAASAEPTIYDRAFKRYDGKRFRLRAWETDMEEMMVELDYDNGSPTKDEDEITSCTIYDGAYEQEEIGERLNETIDEIEEGYSTISDLIELIKELYIHGECMVPLEVGWRGPGDEFGSDFEYKWTE